MSLAHKSGIVVTTNSEGSASLLHGRVTSKLLIPFLNGHAAQ